MIDEQSGVIRGPAFALADNVQLGFVNTKTERDGIVRRSETYRGDHLSFDAVVTDFVPEKKIIPPVSSTILVQPITSKLFLI